MKFNYEYMHRTKKCVILFDVKYFISISTFSTGYLCHSYLSVSCFDHLLNQSFDSAWGHRWLSISLHAKCKFVISFLLK